MFNSRGEDYAEMIRAIPPPETSVSDFAPRACLEVTPEIASRGPNRETAPVSFIRVSRENKKLTIHLKKKSSSPFFPVRILNFTPRRESRDFSQAREEGKLNRRRIWRDASHGSI